MSDPIVDIIHKCMVFPRTGCATDAAKQIRQQIGLEIQDEYVRNPHKSILVIVQEKCKLEEQK